MAAAYSTFARQGTYIAPKTYTMVTDNNGQVLLRNESEEETILQPERTTYYITEMLQQVVTGGSGATGKAANFSGQEIAGKTGTTTSRRDLWFVGYTPITPLQCGRGMISRSGCPAAWAILLPGCGGRSCRPFTRTWPIRTSPSRFLQSAHRHLLPVQWDAGHPACGSNVATGTFYADDVPTSSCTYHRVTVPTTDPDTGATGDETGDNTDPGNTDPGTDPGTDTPPTTDPGTDPTTPPAERGHRDHWPAPAVLRPSPRQLASFPSKLKGTLLWQSPFLQEMTETTAIPQEKLSFRQVLWVAMEGQM